MKTIALAILACLPVFAVGTVSQSINPLGTPVSPSGLPDTRVHLISISWVGDSVNGTVPATVINTSQFPNLSGYRLMSVEIQPGTPSPTPNYSITITDTAGIDILQAVGASLSATVASYSGSLTSPPLITSPTFNLSGNSVASAKGTILLYLAPLSQTTGLPPSGSPSLAGTNVFSGTNTFTGTNTLSGPNIITGTDTGTQTISGAKTFSNNLVIPPSLITQSGAGNVISQSCSTVQRTESAADSNLLTCAIPAVAGSYRLRFVLSISAANAATLGWTATWTNPNGAAEAPTNMIEWQSGTATPALTFVTSSQADVEGTANIDVNNSATSIVVKLTFSGTSFTAKASATVERII